MIKNYFLVALRYMRRNRVFSLINISGMALGMTCSLMIILWVRNEKNTDAFHAKADRLFSVYERQYHDGQVDGFYSTPGLLADEMKKVVPEVEYSCGYAWTNLTTFAAEKKILKRNCNHAGPDFFRMFSYPLLEGNAATALKSPESIAISQNMAVAFFGNAKEALGKTIRYENRKDLMVTAVFENLSDPVSDKFDCLVNWATFLDDNTWAKEWGNNGPRTYLLLRKGTDSRKVELKIKKFLDAYNKEQNANFNIELGLQRFDEMYLHSTFRNGEITGGRIEYVRLFSIIAIFILLIACINFMNLTTARSVKRAKEIGIRKVAGAHRSSLVVQFIGEAILTALFAAIIAIILVMVLLPFYNSITGKLIKIPFRQPLFWVILLALTTVTGIIAGSVPAFILSSFTPVKVLKGTLRFGTSAVWFRKGLVIFQFVLSIILILGTIVISRQINFLQEVNLGYDRENLVYIPLEGELETKYDLFREMALKQTGIKNVTCITQTPTQIDNGTGGVEWEGKEPNSAPQFVQAAVGFDFIKTMNLKLVGGRDFSPDFKSDSVGYILNEAALKIINYKDPVGKPITFWRHKGTIIGIIRDFHFASLHEAIKPIVIRLQDKEVNGSALVRIQPGKTQTALAALEKLCKEINPEFPFSYRFSDEEYQKLYTSEQVIGRLSKYFAFLAIFLSCLGLLGLAMFTAEQRTKEFGIRKVLGAGAGTLYALLSKDFLKLVFVAFILAFPLAWWVAYNWLQNFAYRITISWWMFALAGFLALLIALFSVSFQALKAAVRNPVKSLRTE